MMLKVNELMIGDWVLAHSKPVKLIGVYNDYVSASRVYTEEGGDIREEYIEPIPLNEEILKANGFVDGVLPYTLCNSKLMLSIQDCNECWVFSCYVEDAELNDIMVAYVHELQHALRVCGLTDLADNFKIK